MSTAVTTTEKGLTLGNFLNQKATADFLTKTLGTRKSEFVSNLLALSDSNKELLQCDNTELMKCALNATALNLPLNKNLGYAYVITYKDWKTQKYIHSSKWDTKALSNWLSEAVNTEPLTPARCEKVRLSVTSSQDILSFWEKTLKVKL